MTLTEIKPCTQELQAQYPARVSEETARNAAIVYLGYGFEAGWLRTLPGPLYSQVADEIEHLDPAGIAESRDIAPWALP
jgi:hypothetical protein